MSSPTIHTNITTRVIPEAPATFLPTCLPIPLLGRQRLFFVVFRAYRTYPRPHGLAL